jgi:creatinine amidohydrolase
MSYHLLHDLTREQANELAPEALVVFPTGATEQHGPHMPVGTDCFAVEAVARAAAQMASEYFPVVVAPTLPFGSSQHHLPFGGTMSISTETYYRTVYDLTHSLIQSRFRRIFIINGHGGNNELVQLVARDLALQHPANLAAASYWTTAWDALVSVEAHVPGRLPGHAGAFETSVVLALRPELVQEPRPERPNASGSGPRGQSSYRAEYHGSWQAMDGYTDSPARATAEMGQRYIDAAVPAVAQALREFYTAPFLTD